MKLDQVFGLHAVESLIKNHKQSITELVVLKGRHDKRLSRLMRQAKGLAFRQATRKELDRIAQTETHQGIIAYVAQGTEEFQSSIIKENELPSFLESINGTPLILLLDGVTDPHNFGACLRSADAAGVHLVITPKDRSVGLTPAVRKVASGAAETMPICQVTNLVRSMETLKEAGIWITGTAGEAEDSVYKIDYKGATAIVMGAEGDGLRRLTREHCDYLINIPMAGDVSSLNVSVATGVCLFEVVRQRQQKNNK